MSSVVLTAGTLVTRIVPGRFFARCPSGWADACRTRGVHSLLLLTVACVGLTPRSVGAQATTAPVMTVRHTISAQVGTVTKVVLGVPRRPTAAETSGVAAFSSSEHVANTWAATASVSSNVPGALIIESASLASGIGTTGEPGGGSSANATGWRVVTADGQLVPWSGEPVAVSAAFRAGRHEIVILLVAPDGEAAPPVVNVRVSSM